jgi:hypothetical protein
MRFALANLRVISCLFRLFLRAIDRSELGAFWGSKRVTYGRAKYSGKRKSPWPRRRWPNGAHSESTTRASAVGEVESERVVSQHPAEWNAARLRLMTSAGTLGLTRISPAAPDVP